MSAHRREGRQPAALQSWRRRLRATRDRPPKEAIASPWISRTPLAEQRSDAPGLVRQGEFRPICIPANVTPGRRPQSPTRLEFSRRSAVHAHLVQAPRSAARSGGIEDGIPSDPRHHLGIGEGLLEVVERASAVAQPMERPMRTVLLSIVLVLSLGPGDCPGALAGTDISAAPESSGPPSATQKVAPPDLRGFPTARAPGELGAITLPATDSAVKALFERLPSEVAGHVRSPQFDRISPGRARVGYGEDQRISGARTPLLWLQAIDLSRGDFFPANWTGGEVVAYMAGPGKDAKEAGQDGSLLWMHQEKSPDTAVGSPGRFAVYGTLWGRVDSPWMFSIQADARENRDALLAAFIAAARSSPR